MGDRGVGVVTDSDNVDDEDNWWKEKPAPGK
jgi:hypothetical protein